MGASNPNGDQHLKADEFTTEDKIKVSAWERALLNAAFAISERE
jgi:hypothetical protein